MSIVLIYFVHFSTMCSTCTLLCALIFLKKKKECPYGTGISQNFRCYIPSSIL